MKHAFSSLMVMLCALSVCATSNAQSKWQVLVVRYCDLVANPDGYDGKQIRLRAEYDSGSEHSVFADDHCVKSWDAQKLVWVEFDSALASNTKAPTMARFEKARCRPETDRDGRIMDNSQSWRVELTVVGLFRKSKDPNFGFGHTNSYPFMITVSKVERVGTLTKLRVPKEFSYPEASETVQIALSARSLAGVVRVPNGEVLPDVLVERVSADWKKRLDATFTDTQGRFHLSALPDGKYSLKVSKSGFSTLKVEVRVKKKAKSLMDLALPLGI